MERAAFLEHLGAGGSETWGLVETLSRGVRAAGGRCYVVGGAVRDALLGIDAHDYDLEVFGLTEGRFEETVGRLVAVDAVGESFGVLKVKQAPIDISLARRETRTGRGHRDFSVDLDPEIGVEEATRRRDFTINAMLVEPPDGQLIDPFDGAGDLAARRLRHTSERFAEDPLRVLRGMQLAGRFALAADPATLLLCRSLSMEDLPAERLYAEWRKLILLGRKPSMGLRFLRQASWLRFFPELEALVDCPQDPQWHPEGDVWVHTLQVMDAFAGARVGDDWEDLVVGFACLCHDLGKPATTVFEDGHIRSRGHETAGEEPTRAFLARLTPQASLHEQVVPLVRDHLKPRQLFEAEAGSAAIRRLADRVGRIDRLVRVANADAAGRPPLPADDEPGNWLLRQAEALHLESQRPDPLVQGRHLVARGLEPGPHFRPLLDACFRAQLDGAFSDLAGALRFLERKLEQGAVRGTPQSAEVPEKRVK